MGWMIGSNWPPPRIKIFSCTWVVVLRSEGVVAGVGSTNIHFQKYKYLQIHLVIHAPLAFLVFLRTRAGEKDFFDGYLKIATAFDLSKCLTQIKLPISRKSQICDCSRSKQMPNTDQIADFTPHVRTYSWVAIWYATYFQKKDGEKTGELEKNMAKILSTL